MLTTINHRTNVANELKDSVSILAVTEKLNLVPQYQLTKHGDELTGDCPAGHDSTGHHCFNISLNKHLFHCFSCKESGDIISLVSLVRKVNFKDALRWLAEQFRPELLSLIDKGTLSVDPVQKDYYRKALLYESVFQLGKKQLYEKVGERSLAALEARGYEKANLEKTEWIYWPNESEIRKHLSSTWPHYAAEIASLPLTGYFGDNFRLAFPYRDRRGHITGFMKRADNKKGIEVRGQSGVRWDSTPGLKKDDLFGLDKIQKADTLVILEGYPDALYLPAIGYENVVAVGQGNLSKTHIEGLLAKKIRRVIISFDNDPPKADGKITGVENTESAVDLLAEAGIDVFVLHPPTLGEFKDPDELVVANGIDAFRQLVRVAELGATWKAKRISSRYDIATDIGRDNAMQELLSYESSVTSPIASKAVVDVICSGLHLPEEMIVLHLKTYHEKKATAELSEATKRLLRDASADSDNENPHEIIARLHEESRDLMLEFERAKVGAAPSLEETLQEKRRRDAQREPGQLLGQTLTRFSGICKNLSGVQSGLYILGAYPNVGKTALLTCLMLDVLSSNPFGNAIFCSMDDSRETIINRCLAILTQKEINSVQCRQDDVDAARKINEAYDYLLDEVKRGRLIIKDTAEVTTMDDVELQIRENVRPGTVVFIDGLYNVGTGTDGKQLREENVQRANLVKRLSTTYHLPVITTGELRKRTSDRSSSAKPTMDDLMESGKYGYNADVVWLLYPQEEGNAGSEIIMNLEFVKNKLSSFKETMSLVFTRAMSTYAEGKQLLRNVLEG
jgi:DNA primase catalytic core